MIDCPANKTMAPDPAGCTGTGSGTVQLTHNGKASLPIPLATATPASIETAFSPLHDTAYSAVKATIIKSTRASVVWHLELTTPRLACTISFLCHFWAPS